MNALTVVKEEPQSKRKRERIVFIETPPKADWFVCTQEQGRTVWYLLFCVTGMHPRRFGPFKNRHRALLALDGLIDAVTDVNQEMCDKALAYRFRRRFQHDWGPVIEDALALASRTCRPRKTAAVQSTQKKKGR